MYIIEYTKDRIASFNGIVPAGYRIAEINEILQITVGNNTPEVPRTVVLTATDPSGAAIAAVGGKYQLQYTNGYGSVFVSDFIDYTASQATVQTALNGMQIYGGAKLTAGATNVNSVAGLTVTMTLLNDFDTATQGARWSVLTNSLRSATSALQSSMTDSGGISAIGVPPGNYTLYLWLPKFAVINIFPDRSTTVRDLSGGRSLDGQLF